jgi:hypothetical protein
VLAVNLFGDGVDRFPVTRTNRQTTTLGSEGLSGGSPDSLAGRGNNSDAVSDPGFHKRAIIEFAGDRCLAEHFD